MTRRKGTKLNEAFKKKFDTVDADDAAGFAAGHPVFRRH